MAYTNTKDNRKEGISMKIGYVRVSTEGQNTIRQEVLMKELGVEKVFMDKCSGKDTNRPQLNEMLNFIREGDTVVVESISRFARNTKDLLELIEILAKKNVMFVSKKEAIDTSTSTGKFMLTVFGAVAELERDYIRQRQREGIDCAKAEGKQLGRPAIEYPDTWAGIYSSWKSGKLKAVEAMKQLNLTKPTFYRLVKKYEKSE
jgi:DNA invertase Pin-like site-specific DNA recombinase